MTQFDDDELRAMLEARAGRASLDPVAVIADGRRRAVAASATRKSVRRLVPSLVGIGAIVATVAVVVTLALPTSVRPTGSATVTDDATPIVTPSAVPSEIEGAVTADLLGRLLVEPNTVGRIVFLDGELIPAQGACKASPWCGRSVVGLATPHSVLPADELAAGYMLAPNATKDLYAMRVGPRSAAGLISLSVIGRMQANGSTVAWPIETLAAGLPAPPHQAQPVEDLVEVTGWIVRTPVHPCPSTFRSSCNPTEDFLTVDAYQPVRSGSVIAPPEGRSISLRSGSYDAWAPDPVRFESGVEPRRVTLLVRPVEQCGSRDPRVRDGAMVCIRPAGDMWEVAARLDLPR
jgi:hypothetical protein